MRSHSVDTESKAAACYTSFSCHDSFDKPAWATDVGIAEQVKVLLVSARLEPHAALPGKVILRRICIKSLYFYIGRKVVLRDTSTFFQDMGGRTFWAALAFFLQQVLLPRLAQTAQADHRSRKAHLHWMACPDFG